MIEAEVLCPVPEHGPHLLQVVMPRVGDERVHMPDHRNRRLRTQGIRAGRGPTIAEVALVQVIVGDTQKTIYLVRNSGDFRHQVSTRVFVY